MLDIQFIRDNRKLVEEKSNQKGIQVNLDKLLKLDEKRRKLIGEIGDLQAKRNQLAADFKKEKPSSAEIERGKSYKEALKKAEEELDPVLQQYNELLKDVPNIFPDDTPQGGEEANKRVKTWGEAVKNENIQDHLAWGEQRGFIDFERGSKVAGNKFYYLKGPLVQLELAVFMFALQLAEKHGFIPMEVPHLVNTKTVSGTGFMPRGEERQIYKIEGEDLNLIATAEIPITGYHSDEILNESELPVLYVGLSPAYRMEAGAYGKHSKGLYRVHQFNKLELYVFCKPEESEQWQEKLMGLEEELCQALEIPYEIVRIAAGDMGAPAYKKFDINYWSPVDGEYRELMSCSNVTDYQSRRLNIRFRNETGTHYVHSLNGTAAAFSRIAIALIENFQDKDGNVKIPKVLVPFMGGKKEI